MEVSFPYIGGNNEVMTVQKSIEEWNEAATHWKGIQSDIHAGSHMFCPTEYRKVVRCCNTSSLWSFTNLFDSYQEIDEAQLINWLLAQD